MNKVIYLLTLMFALVMMNSCSKSPKAILLAGDEWLIAMTGESVQNPGNQVLKFVDSTTVLNGETNSYNISWLNDNVFRLRAEGMTAIVNVMYSSEDKLKVAILYENEKIPATQEEWSKLQDENRVIQLVKNKSPEKSPKSYSICGNDIPADKVPPAGIYLNRGYRGDVMGVVKVIISNGIVQFQTGENEGSLKDTPIESFDEYGSFSLKDFMMSGFYDGNGIIKFNNGAMGVDEGEQYDVYNKVSNSNDDITDNLFISAVNKASNIGLIFKDGEMPGKLVIKQFTHNKQKNGFNINIPEDKMWTPLYFEYSNNCEYVTIPRIFSEKLSSTGWERASSYRFPLKKDFVSCKVSTRNTEALSGEIAIMFTEEEYCDEVSYTLYFFEE